MMKYERENHQPLISKVKMCLNGFKDPGLDYFARNCDAPRGSVLERLLVAHDDARRFQNIANETNVKSAVHLSGTVDNDEVFEPRITQYFRPQPSEDDLGPLRQEDVAKPDYQAFHKRTISCTDRTPVSIRFKPSHVYPACEGHDDRHIQLRHETITDEPRTLPVPVSGKTSSWGKRMQEKQIP